MTDARQLRDALRALMVAHGSFDEATRPCGTPLPMPYAHALLTLRSADGLSVTELASHLNIDRSNVSRLAKTLETDGMVERRAHPTDGRATALFLTQAGRERADGVDATSAAHFQKLLGQLGDEADPIISSIRQLIAAMEHS